MSIVFGQTWWHPAAAWGVLCRETPVAAASMGCLPLCSLVLMISTPSLRTILKQVSFEQALYLYYKPKAYISIVTQKG
jgi:hypothetical protein